MCVSAAGQWASQGGQTGGLSFSPVPHPKQLQSHPYLLITLSGMSKAPRCVPEPGSGGWPPGQGARV